ncbi:MAG: DNA polymerase III subunit beta [Alphaproteobacteria bacterium]|jgi:DNA polymerase-3 subunit beta|nr:DNA polymerase III subunit beta [Alphaproteobacteria bacterium]
MKFVINVAQLSKALDNVQGVVDKRNITPILSNIRIAAENDKLIINATDMDLDIVEILNITPVENGSITAPAFLLGETIKRLPLDARVEISLVEDKLHIICGKFKGTLSTLPVDDFPIIQTDNLPSTLKIKKTDFKELMENTKFAISTDETRYYLNGVYLHTTNNAKEEHVLRCVSTDGHRLALADSVVSNDIKIEEGIIIPKKAVEEISKLIDKVADEDLEISCSSSRICFKFSNIILTSKLIDGNFPNYDRVIPKNNDKILEVNRDEFVKAIDLVSMYSDDKLKFIKINLDGNKMILSADKNVGDANQELEIVRAIEPMSICFNAKYIKEICSLIPTENVLLQLQNETSPALVKQMGESSEIFVIMPMRL